MAIERWKSRKNKKRARGKRSFIKSEAGAGRAKVPRPTLSAVGKAIQKIARRGDRGA